MIVKRHIVPLIIVFAFLGGLLTHQLVLWSGRYADVQPGAAQAAAEFTPDEQINIRVYRMASPAVVNITTTAVAYDFFLNPIPKEGTGSGAIIDRAGHILTNFHVIDGARRLEVTLADGSKWPARVVGADPSNDLAVIKIDAPSEQLTVVPLGDSSKLVVGQKVLVIGNPFGLERTLTAGIISSLGRSIRADNHRLIRGIIQTDAAINPGNSGGPVLNSSGEVIGVSTAIFSPSGGSVGVGFAVPINTAKRIIPELISRGYVARPYLGISGHEIFPALAQALRLPVNQGIMVVEVTPGSPAHRAGIRGGDRAVQVGNMIVRIGGDIITQIDNLKVRTFEELSDFIDSKTPGDTIRVTLNRQGQFRTVDVRLRERPQG
ncbi:MAG TPA: trypsin-like peptidase domain-containing protein [Alphaproteobacteria bacterium]|nr:trypsin-like peptidase domain-containing protein [Alphaproteobacteria bacterium]